MSRRPTGGTPSGQQEDLTFDHIFEDLRKVIDQKHENLIRIEKFLERMSTNEELFDSEDQSKVRDIYQERSDEYRKMTEEFRADMDLYRDSVSDLENKIAKRQQVLENIDAEVHAISSEPALAEHFVMKQAQLVNNFRSAKTLLCNTIRDKLGKCTQIKAASNLLAKSH